MRGSCRPPARASLPAGGVDGSAVVTKGADHGAVSQHAAATPAPTLGYVPSGECSPPGYEDVSNSCETRLGPLKRVLAKTLLLAVSLGLALILAELALRLLAPQPASWLAIYERHPVLPFYRLQPNVDELSDTGETRFRVVTDGEGFRVSPGALAEEAEKTVLWLGDSYTFGQGVDYEESFVGMIAADSEPGVRHVNAGVCGYGPVQYRQLLDHFIEVELPFDVVVVVLFLGNDFHDCSWSKDVPVEGGLIGGRGGLKTWIKQSSHLYRFAAATYHRIAKDTPNPYKQTLDQLATPTSWRDGPMAGHEERFRKELSELATRTDRPVRFVVIPTEVAVTWSREGRLAEDYDPLLPVKRTAAALEGQEVLDLLGALARSDPGELFFRFDGHFNPFGSRVAADAIEEAWPDLTRTGE